MVAVIIKVHHPLSGAKLVGPESLLLMKSSGGALLEINATLESLLRVYVVIFLIDSMEFDKSTFVFILILLFKIAQVTLKELGALVVSCLIGSPTHLLS